MPAILPNQGRGEPHFHQEWKEAHHGKEETVYLVAWSNLQGANEIGVATNPQAALAAALEQPTQDTPAAAFHIQLRPGSDFAHDAWLNKRFGILSKARAKRWAKLVTQWAEVNDAEVRRWYYPGLR